VILPALRPRDDRGRLLAMRLTVLGLAAAVLAMALTSKMSIYQLVNESGKVVLVSSFVPPVFAGLLAAILGMAAGSLIPSRRATPA